MAPKRQVFPPKDRSFATYSSTEEEEEEEEEEEDEGGKRDGKAAKSVSPQPSKNLIHKKPTSDLNKAANPDSSSTEEEDFEGEEEYEDEESEDEKGKKAEKMETKPSQIRDKDDRGKANEEEEESDDSSSGSDTPSPKSKPPRPSRVNASVKPIFSKPMDNPSKPKKITLASPAINAQKRPASTELLDMESRKRKKADPGEEEEETCAKKQLFQRIWSPEDEISILKAMIEFAKKGSDVSSDPAGFHEFVKKFIQVDMSRSQVSEKIRRTRKKFFNNARKAFKGKEPPFSKDHDLTVYQLSKKIWGAEVEAEHPLDKMPAGITKEAPKLPAVKQEKPSFEHLDFENHLSLANGGNDNSSSISSLYPFLNESLHSAGVMSDSGLGENDVKKAIELMGEAQAKEWDERWKTLRWKEKDAFMERVSMVYELVKQCYELVKSSK